MHCLRSGIESNRGELVSSLISHHDRAGRRTLQHLSLILTSETIFWVFRVGPVDGRDSIHVVNDDSVALAHCIRIILTPSR